MGYLVIITGSSTFIVSSSRYRHHHQHHLFNPKQSPILPLNNPIFVSLFKPPSPSPLSSSSSPPSSTTRPLIPPRLEPLNGDDQSDKLGSFAEYASKSVEDGRFEDFGMVAKSVLTSGVVGVSDLVRLLNPGIVTKGIAKGLREGRIRSVVEFLECFSQLGIDVLGLFDEATMKLLKKECLQLVNSGNLEEAVEVMEALAGMMIAII